MVDTGKLRGKIAENGLSQRKVAEALNMSEKTFYTKMKKGIFGTDDVERMIKLLHIENPVEIFLSNG